MSLHCLGLSILIPVGEEFKKCAAANYFKATVMIIAPITLLCLLFFQIEHTIALKVVRELINLTLTFTSCICTFIFGL